MKVKVAKQETVDQLFRWQAKSYPNMTFFGFLKEVAGVEYVETYPMLYIISDEKKYMLACLQMGDA